MLRITENLESCETLRLRLDGTITLENFHQVEELCAQHRQDNLRMIILDMAGVTFINDAVAKNLADLRCDSVRIINCSPFIAALLKLANNPD